MINVPKDSSFVTELQFVYVVVILFRDEKGEMETGVFVYHKEEDAKKRFERLMDTEKWYQMNGKDSPLIMTETFRAGIYENFEQSLFSESGNNASDKVM